MNILALLERKVIPPLNSILYFILENNIPITKHPLGFYCCKILENELNSIRLHFWLKGNFRQKGFEIHDHVFDLESHILQGDIQNITYEITNEIFNHNYFSFNVTYKNSCSKILLNQAKKNIKIKEIKKYSKGDIYFLNSDEIHQSKVLSKKAITLLYTTRSEKSRPTVFSKKSIFNMSHSRKKISDIKRDKLVQLFIDEK